MDIELGMPGQIMPPLDRAIANALRNEADGFDAVWWPDHLMGWFPDSLWTEDLTPLARSQANPHVHVDPLMVMAAAGAQMTKAKVGVVVTDLIRRNPAVLAQTMLTLDHLTQGRAILGLGIGGAAQHRAVRDAVRPAGRQVVRGHRRHAAALGVRRAGHLRGPIPPVGQCRPRHVALRPVESADLDRGARSEDARTHRAQGRWLAADEDGRPRVPGLAGDDPRQRHGGGSRPGGHHPRVARLRLGRTGRSRRWSG